MPSNIESNRIRREMFTTVKGTILKYGRLGVRKTWELVGGDQGSVEVSYMRALREIDRERKGRP